MEKITGNIISTKANTLYAMKNLIKKARIEKMYILKVEDFWRDKERVCQEIRERFEGSRIVVRSSSTQEDSLKYSNAGHYKSILDVDSASLEEIQDSVEQVIASYQEDMESVLGEQVLIQRQATDVCLSGVIFTRNLKGDRPYYLVNYDDRGSTDSVTSGRGGKMLWIAKDIMPKKLPPHWKSLVQAVREVENIIEGIPLDIEFAIDSNNEIILFQVRPLAAGYHETDIKDDHAFFLLKKKVREQYERKVDIITGRTMKLSDMAFWNPSEIIGTNPKTLDYSLYREIITHNAWNSGINKLGYRKLDQDLMYQVGNKPYINLNYSFYSLIPASVSEGLAMRLVDFYQKRLEEDLSAHDKIEFEIAYSSYDFMTEKNSLKMLEYGFTEEERRTLIDAVKEITIDAVNNQDRLIKEDMESLAVLDKCRDKMEQLRRSDAGIYEIAKGILELLNTLETYGTPQFARQARIAFIARSFIRTLSEAGYYSHEETDGFMKSISTVSSAFNDDFEQFSNNKMSSEEFYAKYGHLRSDTYDIRSERYDAMNFRPVSARNKTPKNSKYLDIDLAPLKKALDDNGIDIPEKDFKKFLIKGIEQREYFKFEFTKSLSLVLELIRKIGNIAEVRVEDLSWLSVADIRAIRKDVQSEALKEKWLELAYTRRKQYREYRTLLLPEVILSPLSFDIIPVYEARPNFITSKRIEGEVVMLEDDKDADITGRIVVLTKADPGYEWIFTKNIKGFITKYGGAASHMAIRCAEFDIPAAIGCGEKIYNAVSKMDYLELDCKNGEIKPGIQYNNLHALITQREGVNAYGDPTDILESAYMRFYELMGFIPKPVSNHNRNIEKLFDDKIDLLIVVGGGSLQPECYDRPHNDEIQPHRDITEEKLIRYCIKHGIPIVATCRGMQYINVLFGGRLHYHPKLKIERPRGVDHPVRLVKEDRIIQVNNYHQDVIYEGELAPCFEVLAVDEQNHTIEAYGSEEMKLLALQWHPERKFETAEAQDETRKIIVNFIQSHIR